MIVTIYTDGGADPNPGVGGWAAILKAGGKEKVLTGNELSTTNNRMELTAAIAALKALRRPSRVQLHTDSEYLRKGITEWIGDWQAGNWQRKGKPVPNADLWQTLWTLTKQHEVEWRWVRGHSGDQMNERVDRLARNARLAIMPVEQMSPESRRLYIKGSCKGNPGPGAWGAVLEAAGDQTWQLSGSEPTTTSNRMELEALVEGLSMAPVDEPVYVLTSSDYVYMGATRWIDGWRRRDWKKKNGQPVSNQDLWQRLLGMLQERTVHWVSAKGTPGEHKQGLDEAARLAKRALEMER